MGDGDDFFFKDFSEIENDKDLQLFFKDEKERYQKTADGIFKNVKNLKEKQTFHDLVCQKYKYECESDLDLTYYAWRIFETTDEDLQQFVGKAFVQKVDEQH